MPGVDIFQQQQSEHPRLPLKWPPTTTFTPVSCYTATVDDKLLTSSGTSNCCTRAGSSNKSKSTQKAVKSSNFFLSPSYRHNGQLRLSSSPEATALARTPPATSLAPAPALPSPMGRISISLAPFHQRPLSQQQQPPIQATATMSSPITCHLVFVDAGERHCSTLQTAQFSTHRLPISAPAPLPPISSFSNISYCSSSSSAVADDQTTKTKATAVCSKRPTEEGRQIILSRLGQLFDSFTSSSTPVTINCAISSSPSTSRHTSSLQHFINLFFLLLLSPVLSITEDAKRGSNSKMLHSKSSSSRGSSRCDQKGHQRQQRRSGSFFRATALLCTLFLAMSSPSLSSASPSSFQSSSSVLSSIPSSSASSYSSHHQSSPLSLHRHHHPSHPHSYQNRAQQQQVNYQESGSPSQLYSSSSFKSYNFNPHQFMQSEQPFGLQYGSQPPKIDRPAVADRTVRRISTAAESSNYYHNLHAHSDVHGSSKAHYQPNSRIHHTFSTTVSRSSSPSKNTSPSPSFDPTKVCPEGPPSQWANQLDVAAKAYLAPVVFTGQLVSLSEDFGGRIAATFRLLRLLKPTEVHGGNLGGSANHHHHNQHHNSSAVAALSALTNADYERHVKLFFFNRTGTTASEPPYCAPYMADIKERLVTKQNYLLFAHEHVIATYRVRATSAPSSSANHHHNLQQQQQQHHHQQSSSTRFHTPIELISLVTYADPEPLNRNSSRLVRKVLCKGCAKAAVVHSSASTITVPVRGNITLACRMDGTPLPWIEWYRNGKRLRAREGKRVIIKRKRRVSHLTITRASWRRDKGVYECRAMNVVSKEPAVKRFQVIVTRSSTSSGGHNNNRWYGGDRNSGRRLRPVDDQIAGQSSTTVSGGSTPSSHHFNPSVQQPYLPSTSTSRRPVEPPDYYDSHETGQNPFSRKPIGFFHGQPCPIPDYCLNGGTCSLYETLGEYVCQCADGYRGQRCEFKDINKYPAHKALLDYDLNTRMLHTVMSQKTSEDDA